MPPTAPSGRPAVPLIRAGVVGAAAGALSGLFGVGGGILMVPAMVLLLGVDQRRASATSLVAIVPIAVLGAGGYALQGEIDVAAGLLLAAGAVAGAPLGVRLLERLPLAPLRWGFAALLVASAVRLLFELPEPTARAALTPVIGLELVVLGMLSGVLAGLFGVGGGIILVPAQMLLLGISPAVAKGTSLLVIIPTAISGTVGNLRRGNADLRLAAVLGGAGLLTSFAGAFAATRVPDPLANALFAALMVASAARMVGQGRSR